MIQNYPNFGSTFFVVKQTTDTNLPECILIAINRHGFNIIDPDKRVSLLSYFKLLWILTCFTTDNVGRIRFFTTECLEFWQHLLPHSLRKHDGRIEIIVRNYSGLQNGWPAVVLHQIHEVIFRSWEQIMKWKCHISILFIFSWIQMNNQ